MLHNANQGEKLWTSEKSKKKIESWSTTEKGNLEDNQTISIYYLSRLFILKSLLHTFQIQLLNNKSANKHLSRRIY